MMDVSPSFWRKDLPQPGCVDVPQAQGTENGELRKWGKGGVLEMIWVFPKIMVPPQIIHFNRVFHYKPSILGGFSPYFWKHPYAPVEVGTLHPIIYKVLIYPRWFSRRISEASTVGHGWLFSPLFSGGG